MTATGPGIRTNSGAYQGAATLASATVGTPGTGCQMIVSVSGTVTLTLNNGSTVSVYASTTANNVLPFSVLSWVTGTATVTTFWNLY